MSQGNTGIGAIDNMYIFRDSDRTDILHDSQQPRIPLAIELTLFNPVFRKNNRFCSQAAQNKPG
ncbi:hypothetical protein [Microcoleus sp. herbarium12]|uniref:hypothetical protein n=1 Tax=Microcoleus sp. herbarium12 TaxID=3055437 RepID=UPI002FCED5D0